MRKTLLLCLFAMAVFQLNAQYFQNFDSLAHGDYIGVKDAAWTTWSNTPGSSEDAKVDTNQAFTPNNSIYFSSTSASGGPQDAVLNFGASYNTGFFEYSQAMYIPQNKGAYFNFQGETTIGSLWALNCNFINDSMMYIDDAIIYHVSMKYPVATWFNFKIKVNLNTNTWELYIDNILEASWQNTVNKIASLDVFPMCSSDLNGNNQSEFWIDDVGFSHTPYTLPTLNAGILSLTFNRAPINGQINEPKIKVRNLGTTTITSFDIDIIYNGATIQKSITGLSIPSLGSYDFIVPPGVTIDANATSLQATITAVNGGQDMDSTDDSKTHVFVPIIPALGKMVIVEEATGTWCGWCPRGAVALEFLARDYHGLAQGIAVHNGDPMTDSIYDAEIGNLISGYPSAIVDRGNSMNPSTIWASVNEALATAPTAFLVNGAQYNASTNKLEVSITADFKASANNNWKLACVLVEDSVTGTTTDYSQSNSYSGGGSGDLFMPDGTNWALLPSKVPYSQMVYNHVARAISPGFDGYQNGFPTNVTLGDVHTVNFVFYLDNSWDYSKIHIVGMLIKPDGSIDNGSSASIPEAIGNGYVPGVNAGITEYFTQNTMNLYPNPVTDNFTINLNNKYKNLNLEIRNSLGQLVYNKDIENPDILIDVNLQSEPGVYFVRIRTDNGVEETFKIIRL